MGAIKLNCPKCGWVLGDTEQSVDCVINCPKCNAVRVRMTVTNFREYDELLSYNKEANDNGKSK